MDALAPLLGSLVDPQEREGNQRMPSAIFIEVGVQAHSLAAYAYYTKYMADRTELEQIRVDASLSQRAGKQSRPCDQIDNVVRPAMHANTAAKFQFISQAVLMAGFAFKGLAESLNIDIWTFKEYAPLWRALAAHEVTLPRNWKAIAGVRPPANRCARHGCAKGEPRFRLFACPGQCPKHMKPKYCSKECHVRHFRFGDSDCVLTFCPCQDSDHLPAMCAGVVMLSPPPTVVLSERTRTAIVELRSTRPVLQAEIEVGHTRVSPEAARYERVDSEEAATAFRWMPQTRGLRVRYVRKTYL